MDVFRTLNNNVNISKLPSVMKSIGGKLKTIESISGDELQNIVYNLANSKNMGNLPVDLINIIGEKLETIESISGGELQKIVYNLTNGKNMGNLRVDLIKIIGEKLKNIKIISGDELQNIAYNLTHGKNMGNLQLQLELQVDLIKIIGEKLKTIESISGIKLQNIVSTLTHGKNMGNLQLQLELQVDLIKIIGEKLKNIKDISGDELQSIVYGLANSPHMGNSVDKDLLTIIGEKLKTIKSISGKNLYSIIVSLFVGKNIGKLSDDLLTIIGEKLKNIKGISGDDLEDITYKLTNGRNIVHLQLQANLMGAIEGQLKNIENIPGKNLCSIVTSLTTSKNIGKLSDDLIKIIGGKLKNIENISGDELQRIVYGLANSENLKKLPTAIISIIGDKLANIKILPYDFNKIVVSLTIGGNIDKLPDNLLMAINKRLENIENISADMLQTIAYHLSYLKSIKQPLSGGLIRTIEDKVRAIGYIPHSILNKINNSLDEIRRKSTELNNEMRDEKSPQIAGPNNQQIQPVQISFTNTDFQQNKPQIGEQNTHTQESNQMKLGQNAQQQLVPILLEQSPQQARISSLNNNNTQQINSQNIKPHQQKPNATSEVKQHGEVNIIHTINLGEMKNNQPVFFIMIPTNNNQLYYSMNEMIDNIIDQLPLNAAAVIHFGLNCSQQHLDKNPDFFAAMNEVKSKSNAIYRNIGICIVPMVWEVKDCDAKKPIPYGKIRNEILQLAVKNSISLTEKIAHKTPQSIFLCLDADMELKGDHFGAIIKSNQDFGSLGVAYHAENDPIKNLANELDLAVKKALPEYVYTPECSFFMKGGIVTKALQSFYNSTNGKDGLFHYGAAEVLGLKNWLKDIGALGGFQSCENPPKSKKYPNQEFNLNDAQSKQTISKIFNETYSSANIRNFIAGLSSALKIPTKHRPLLLTIAALVSVSKAMRHGLTLEETLKWNKTIIDYIFNPVQLDENITQYMDEEIKTHLNTLREKMREKFLDEANGVIAQSLLKWSEAIANFLLSENHKVLLGQNGLIKESIFAWNIKYQKIWKEIINSQKLTESNQADLEDWHPEEYKKYSHTFYYEYRQRIPQQKEVQSQHLLVKPQGQWARQEALISQNVQNNREQDAIFGDDMDKLVAQTYPQTYRPTSQQNSRNVNGKRKNPFANKNLQGESPRKVQQDGEASSMEEEIRESGMTDEELSGVNSGLSNDNGQSFGMKRPHKQHTFHKLFSTRQGHSRNISHYIKLKVLIVSEQNNYDQCGTEIELKELMNENKGNRLLIVDLNTGYLSMCYNLKKKAVSTQEKFDEVVKLINIHTEDRNDACEIISDWQDYNPASSKKDNSIMIRDMFAYNLSESDEEFLNTLKGILNDIPDFYPIFHTNVKGSTIHHRHVNLN